MRWSKFLVLTLLTLLQVGNHDTVVQIRKACTVLIRKGKKEKKWQYCSFAVSPYSKEDLLY